MAGNEKLTEGRDYYINPEGNWVFTSTYHLKRGSCCQSGCRHCPYGNSPVAERFHDVVSYHLGSKHHPNRYAPGPGQMNWSNQPNPFRRYEGTLLLPLTKAAMGESPSYLGVLSA